MSSILAKRPREEDGYGDYGHKVRCLYSMSCHDESGLIEFVIEIASWPKYKYLLSIHAVSLQQSYALASITTHRAITRKQQQRTLRKHTPRTIPAMARGKETAISFVLAASPSTNPNTGHRHGRRHGTTLTTPKRRQSLTLADGCKKQSLFESPPTVAHTSSPTQSVLDYQRRSNLYADI